MEVDWHLTRRSSAPLRDRNAAIWVFARRYRANHHIAPLASAYSDKFRPSFRARRCPFPRRGSRVGGAR